MSVIKTNEKEKIMKRKPSKLWLRLVGWENGVKHE